LTQPSPSTRSSSLSELELDDLQQASKPSLLEPARLPDHIDALYRAAYALSGSRQDAEDLVQETFARVLKRPRFVRRDHELGYLLRTLRNTFLNSHRAASRRPETVMLVEDTVAGEAAEPAFSASEIMNAVASAPGVYRDAVIAVDVMGMSYREAARALRARQETITTRLYRGRQHISRALTDGATAT
jgi:RNA polymerase sigma-70 factor, ECF subfamily